MCKKEKDFSLIAFNKGEEIFKDYKKKFTKSNRFDFVNGFVTGSEISYDLFINFTKWVIELKDSDIDSIDYHFYLNSSIEELFFKFILLNENPSN